MLWKNASLDILKLFLSLTIVIYHQFHTEWPTFGNNFADSGSWIYSCLILLFNCKVPLFIIISGFLSTLSRNNNLNGFIKLGIDTIFYWIIAIILGAISIFALKTDMNFTRILTYGGRDWWYLWSFIFVKCLSPILIAGFKSINKIYSAFIIILLSILFWVFIDYSVSILFHPGSIFKFALIYCIGIWIGLYGKGFIKTT